MADKTTDDNPEVGTLDTFLSQNTAENTVENTGQNEINSTKPNKTSPETDENTLSVSTNDPSSRPQRLKIKRFTNPVTDLETPLGPSVLI